MKTIDFPKVALNSAPTLKVAGDAEAFISSNQNEWCYRLTDAETTEIWFDGNRAFIFPSHLPSYAVEEIISIFETGFLIGKIEGRDEHKMEMRVKLGL